MESQVRAPRPVHTSDGAPAMSTIVHSLRDYRPPTRGEQFALSFGLPLEEVPYVDEAGNRAEILSAVLSLSNPEAEGAQEDLVFAGRLTLTPGHLCFASQGDRGRGCRLAIPLSTVRRVERLNTRDVVFALSITVWHGMQLVRHSLTSDLPVECSASDVREFL